MVQGEDGTPNSALTSKRLKACQPAQWKGGLGSGCSGEPACTCNLQTRTVSIVISRYGKQTEFWQVFLSSSITSCKGIQGKSGSSNRFYFLGLQNHCRRWLQSWNWKTLAPWKERSDKPSQCIKKQRHHFADKGLSSQSYGFSSSHVWMWELGCKESLALKKWCFWTVVLEKTLESPLDCKEIKSVNPKEIKPEYSLEGLMLKLKLQYFDYLMWRTDTFEKTLMLGKIEGRKRRDTRGWYGWMASSAQWTWE